MESVGASFISTSFSLIFWKYRQVSMLLQCFVAFIWLLKSLYAELLISNTRLGIKPQNFPHSWWCHNGSRSRHPLLCWLFEAWLSQQYENEALVDEIFLIQRKGKGCELNNKTSLAEVFVLGNEILLFVQDEYSYAVWDNRQFSSV